MTNKTNPVDNLSWKITIILLIKLAIDWVWLFNYIQTPELVQEKKKNKWTIDSYSILSEHYSNQMKNLYTGLPYDP